MKKHNGRKARVELQPEDLKLGGMVGVQVAVSDELEWTQEEHKDAVYSAYICARNAPSTHLVLEMEDNRWFLVCEREYLSVVEQLIAEAWGLA